VPRAIAASFVSCVLSAYMASSRMTTQRRPRGLTCHVRRLRETGRVRWWFTRGAPNRAGDAARKLAPDGLSAGWVWPSTASGIARVRKPTPCNESCPCGQESSGHATLADARSYCLVPCLMAGARLRARRGRNAGRTGDATGRTRGRQELGGPFRRPADCRQGVLHSRIRELEPRRVPSDLLRPNVALALISGLAFAALGSVR
jgi:hypothetical protein